MPGFTAIIDYGIGNLHSVSKALDYIGIKTEYAARRVKSKQRTLILPGSARFRTA